MRTIFDWSKIDTVKTSGKVKLKCPECSDTRSDKKDKSLAVNLSEGYAKCFYCESLSFRENIKRDVEVRYTLPSQEWKNYTELSDGLVKWLEDTRKITQSTAINLGITQEMFYQPKDGKEMNNIVFNYFEGDVVVNKKYRSGAKNFSQSTNGKPIFYNINGAVGCDEVYIVEGEFDVLALYEIGIKNAISVPNGANDNDAYWVNSEPYLKDVKRFFIATDDDEKGNALADKIVQRLGRWKCERINFQGKDANEDLINGILESSINDRTSYPVSGTFKVEDIIEDVFTLYNNGFPDTIYPKHHSFGNLKNMFSVMRGHLVTGTGIPSHGKALDTNTNIPTPNGFVRLIDLKVGDIVFDENGKQCNIKWKSEIFNNRPTYKLTFSDNSTLIADENHEWLTDTWKSRRSNSNSIKNNRSNVEELKPKGNNQIDKRTFASIKTTKEIANSIKIKGDNRNNHSIKNSLPIKTIDSVYDIHPYVLGCWLGDGSSSDGGITSDDIQIIENIRNRGFEVRKRSSKYGYGIIDLKRRLNKYSLLGNKHIPTNYLFGSVEQRLELLRGLMDTDGHCSKVEARNEYCGINKELCENVFSLVCSLGIKATFVEGDAMLNGKFISKKYRVFFKTNLKVFNLDRKQLVIDNYFKSGRVVRGNNCRYITSAELVYGYSTQCIEVDSDSHLFLAGNQFIPTHNSNYTEWYVLNLVRDYNMKVSFFSPEHHPLELHHALLMQKTYGKNFFEDYDGCPRISKEEILKYKEWANEKIYLTAPENNEFPTWDWLLNKFKEQMFCYGVDIFVIDAFNKLEFASGGNKLEQINQVLTKLTMFAQMNNVIIFLIAHPTKMKKNESGIYESPTLYDVSGSSDFRNQTHDGFCIYRNFVDEGFTTFTNLKTKMSFQGEIGGSVDFDYHIPSGRYYERGTMPPTYSLIEDIKEEEQIKQEEDYIDYSLPFINPSDAFDNPLDSIPF